MFPTLKFDFRWQVTFSVVLPWLHITGGKRVDTMKSCVLHVQRRVDALRADLHEGGDGSHHE